MGTPFTAEEQLVRRSLFSSLFDVANRLRQTSANRPTVGLSEDFDEHQQPCCSSQLFQPQAQSVAQQQPLQHPIAIQSQTAPDFEPSYQYGETSNQPPPYSPPFINQSSPTTALGHQLDRQLDLNTFFPPPLSTNVLEEHQNQQNAVIQQQQQHLSSIERLVEGQSPHEIYREIVRECRELEQQQPAAIATAMETIVNNPKDHMPICSPTLEHLAALQTNSPAIQVFADESAHHQASQQQHQPLLSLSLEHLVKIVVATVREITGAGITGAGVGQKNGNRGTQKQQTVEKVPVDDEEIVTESAEVILERRRLQNNTAAARYRRRQRQVESGLQHELNQLERRNWELKTEMAQLQAEIDTNKRLLRGMRGAAPIDQ